MTEKRSEMRFSVSVPIRWTNANRIIESSTRDISYSGVFIQTLAPCSIGDKINATIPVENGDTKIQIEGEVRWIRVDENGNPEGMGVFFLRDLTPTERVAMEAMLIDSNTETLIA